ncbi:Helix-turn-helix [Anaerosporobacter mobilis DSM 15930]|uniref:Helix-turn-helix n=1 Tax=Anaerosporobacter mobilis DSM 15930 TaxID=1120996 RepID=A0A1M7N7I5_9FIRM|nr:helix-turn-helix transcriptional regulator [Anaerosporobacter mobilis]SHM99423.1 Helix-turn-helix [Anaerosporobacter mobilis DSM 15930]
MTTGEKIRYFRKMRGISQEFLGRLSGINSATIKKYESGIRNPKPDQLLKIANALGISINLFMDFDISTVSDVLSLLFKMDEQVDMNFEAEKDANGNYIPSTMKISFKSYAINDKLCTYLKVKKLQESIENDNHGYSDKEQHQKDIDETTSNIEEIKNHLVDDNIVVKKGTTGITVKMLP